MATSRLKCSGCLTTALLAAMCLGARVPRSSPSHLPRSSPQHLLWQIRRHVQDAGELVERVQAKEKTAPLSAKAVARKLEISRKSLQTKKMHP